MHEMHVVFRDVVNEIAFEMRKLSDAYPGAIEIVDAVQRQTPWKCAEVEVPRANLPRPIRTSIPLVLKMDGALDQIVGSVRDEAWKEDLERRPFERTLEDGTTEVDLGGYRASRDTVGSRGMEKNLRMICVEFVGNPFGGSILRRKIEPSQHQEKTSRCRSMHNCKCECRQRSIHAQV